MLSQDELLALLSDLESDRIERTRSTDKTDKFAQAVCAFANDFAGHRRPGYLFIGVEDSGELAGLKVSDQMLQNFAALRSDGNILPLPAITVTNHSLPGGDVAVVEVQPSDLPPVRYKGQVWIRVGPRKAIASEQEERLLSERRVAYARSFDAQACREASLRDLSLGLFDAYRRKALAPEVIEANHRPPEQQLSSLRFLDPHFNCPTYAGILLLGLSPRRFLPGAYIQYLRLPGVDLADDPLDQAEIAGDLEMVLRELDARIRANIRTHLQPVSALREETLSDYPEWAIRELLMNAIMHRDYHSNTPISFYWYADRIEIKNPGGLYGEVTPENFTTRNSYRNPVIAEAMKSLGYVNRYGHGIQRAQKLLRDNQNPEAEFEFDGRTVVVRISLSKRPQPKPASVVRPIQNIVGPPVSGTNFFGREAFIEKIWNILGSGDSILLSAPRRFGKTSVLRHLVEHPQAGFHVVYLSFEGIRDINELITYLLRAIEQNASLMAALQTPVKAGNAATVNSTESQKVLAKSDNWKTALLDLFDRIAKTEQPVVFCLDELAYFVAQLDSAKNHKSDAIDLLLLLRGTRVHYPKLSFVFVLGEWIGVVRGFERKTSASPPFNDCVNLRLPPFSRHEAEQFLEALAVSSHINLDAPTRDALLDTIGAYDPYSIQSIWKTISDAKIAQLTQESIHPLYIAMLSDSTIKHYLDSYRQTLKLIFNPGQEKAAKAILQELAKAGELSREACYKIYQSILAEQADFDGFVELMADLESAYYLSYNMENKTYGFYSKLLRDGWLRYYTL